jgi:hypothetical protein
MFYHWGIDLGHLALEFAPGDYVYVCRAVVNNTLQMPVYDEVLRIERTEALGVAILAGRDLIIMIMIMCRPKPGVY